MKSRLNYIARVLLVVISLPVTHQSHAQVPDPGGPCWTAICRIGQNCANPASQPSPPAPPFYTDSTFGYRWTCGTGDDICGDASGTPNPFDGVAWSNGSDAPNTGTCQSFCTNGIDFNVDPTCAWDGEQPYCPQGAFLDPVTGTCAVDGNGPTQCENGSALISLENGSTMCAEEIQPPECLNTVGYINGQPICFDGKDACEATGGTYGAINSQEVCIPSDYAEQLPTCTPGSYNFASSGDGSGFACSTPTDNPDGTNNIDRDGDGVANGSCDPTQEVCPSQFGSQDTDGDGYADIPDACFGSTARQCRYDVCATQGLDSSACGACVANPLGAACHAPCATGFVSDGSACVSDPNAGQGDPTAEGLGTYCQGPGANTSLCQQVAGQCDPTSVTYYQCIGAVENLDFDQATWEATLSGFVDNFEQAQLDEIAGLTAFQSGIPLPDGLISDMQSRMPSGVGCSPYVVDFGAYQITIGCDRLQWMKSTMAWMLYLVTAWYLFRLAITPVQSRV